MGLKVALLQRRSWRGKLGADPCGSWKWGRYLCLSLNPVTRQRQPVPKAGDELFLWASAHCRSGQRAPWALLQGFGSPS